jgi:thiamine pyrophosphate-dependent acetolactate synthase large subunit-like protein
MKVSEALAEAFISEETENVFGLMGDANLHWWSEMAGRGTRMVSARHETAAVAMADGYAQATGRVGVATVTCGPALVHTATPLTAASRGRTPLVLFAGDTPPATLGNSQDVDQRRVAELCEAGFVAVRSPATVADDVWTAFYRARTESRPIVLNVPMDLQSIAYPGEWRYEPSLELTQPPQRPVPDSAACGTVADLVAEAHRPVVLVGRGAMASGARSSVLALARRVGALIATTMPAKGWLDDDEFAVGIVGPLASAIGQELFSEADLVIAVGAGLDRYTTTDGGAAFPKARIVSVTTTPTIKGGSRRPDLFLTGDADACVRALVDLLEQRGVAHDGFRTSETRERIASSTAAVRSPTDDSHGLDPRTVMRVLEPHLGDAEDVVVGVGHFLSFAAMHLRRPIGGHFYWSHYFGSIGYALPIGIGIAAARPDRRVTVIEGDGSLMMSLPELETAARSGLDLRVVVVNDQALGAEMHKLRAVGLDPADAHLPTPDFGAVGRVLGGTGDLVTNAEELRRSLDRYRSEGPGLHVIDARTDRDAMSEMYHKLHFGRPHEAPHQRMPTASEQA